MGLVGLEHNCLLQCDAVSFTSHWRNVRTSLIATVEKWKSLHVWPELVGFLLPRDLARDCCEPSKHVQQYVPPLPVSL